MSIDNNYFIRRLFTIFVITALLFTQIPAVNTLAAVKSISGLADWTGVSSLYSDPVGDGGGKGQSTDITGLGIINDGTKIYVRWDVIIGSSALNGLSSEYMVSFAPVGSYLDGQTNLKFDVSLNKGNVASVKAFYATASGTSSASLSTSDASVLFDNNNTSSGGVAHILLAVPFTEIANLPSINSSAKIDSTSKRYIWGGSASSNVSISSAYTDVVPNGGGTSQNILNYDAATGTSTPVMTTNPLITMNAVAANPIVSSGGTVTYKLTISNQGAATNLYSITWQPSNASFTYSGMGNTGTIATAPSPTSNPITWSFGTPVSLSSNSTTTMIVNIVAGAAASATPYNSNVVANIGSTSGTTSSYDSGATAYTLVTSSAVSAPVISSSSATTTTAAINWSSVTGAASYRIYVDGVQVGSTSGTNYTITGLSSNTTYSITATTVNGSSTESKSSNIVYVTTVSSKLTTPTGLSWDGSTPGLAKWSAVTHASSYTLQLYKDGSAEGSPATNVNTNSYDFTSTIESAGTGDFTFVVTAVGDVTNYTNSDPSSHSIIYTYLSYGIPLNPPTGLAWDGSTPGLARWAPVLDASSYSVQLYKNGSPEGTEVTGITNLSYNFTSAITNAGTGSYTFVVKAVGDGLDFTNSDPSSASSAYAYTAPATKLATPSGLSWDGSTPALARWSAVAHASSYSVQLYKDGSAQGSLVTGVNTNSYDFTTVIAGAGTGSYTFVVTAVGDTTNFTDSDPSSASSAYAYTAPATKLATPSGLSWDGSTPALARWSAVAHATSYSVQLYKDGSAQGSLVTGVNTSSYDFTSVIAGAGTGSYTFVVTAVGDTTNFTDSDPSSASSAYAYTAPATKLATPSGLSWDGSTPALARWSAVAHATSYSVQLYKDGSAQGSPVTGVNTSSYDFTTVIAGAGTGSYTFVVTAVGDTTNFTNSDPSSASSAYGYDADISVVDAARNAAANASYANIAQTAITDVSSISQAIQATAQAAVNNSRVVITVNTISYTPSIEGTETNEAGTNGSYVFTITVSISPHSQTTIQKTIAITATAFQKGNILKNQEQDSSAPTSNMNNSIDDLRSKVFTSEELALIEAGANANVILRVTDINDSVGASDKNLVTAALSNGQTVGTYFDLSLYKKIGSSPETRVTNTSGNINFSIEVPESYWNSNPNLERVFQILRIHEGVASLINGTYDSSSHLFTFDTDRFSTYALVYSDVSSYTPILLTAKTGRTSQWLSYKRIPGADGYIIYAASCAEDLKRIAEVNGDVTRYKHKNLKPATYYKYKVKAFKMINGTQVILSSSIVVHSTTESPTFGNPEKVFVPSNTIKLSTGKKTNLAAEIVLPENKIVDNHSAPIRYESVNKKIATVSSNGSIKAIAKGKVSIYVYAQNGLYKKVTVTVK